MTQIDDATLSIGTGKFYTGAVDLAAPATAEAMLAPAGGWTAMGHTSLEDILAFASEGGEATSLGTLQNKVLRTKYSARVETFSINLQQFDVDSLELYFGSNLEEIGVDSIWSGVPLVPTLTTSAFLAVFSDGDQVFGVYAPKAEIFRSDDLDLSDTESLASLPLGIKPLQSGSNDWAYAVTPLV